MLETRELCKTYKPKKGVPVMAVDHVSLKFPEKGMVFLLGKSGSGKSTMLNLLGGLDQYDGGEIIIKGMSSKDFSQQRFDSYRNTYVGFIFQEYNVLEEFTVGANIGLALELQGKKATDEELNRILTTVDLAGYGNRKPNELSGGQKQRVAIARALVKNPEIIMADEPTGALDSATGRQVLDTLKKLSAEKLVIIVSHDREYAEMYADRIIELADGKVIRDVENVAVSEDAGADSKQLRFRQTSIEIPPDYHLTEEDRIRINEYLDKLRTGASIMMPSQTRTFRDTDESKIPVQDGSKFSLIKSKLPLNCAFKIGCSSLKHKRFRLVMTILLSVAAFTLFALVDTFGAYNRVNTAVDSILDSELNYLSLTREARVKREYDDEEDEDAYYYTENGQHFSDADIEQISKDTGITMTGIFKPRWESLGFGSQYDGEYEFAKKGAYDFHFSSFSGFAEVNAQMLKDMKFDIVAGSLPGDGKNEIAISAAVCDTFVKAGYLPPSDDEEEEDNDYRDDGFSGMKEKPAKQDEKKEYQKITSPADMIGKTIRLMGEDYTVTGVVDTRLDLEHYSLLNKKSDEMSEAEMIVAYLLEMEYDSACVNSLAGCVMVGKGVISRLAEKEPRVFDTFRTSFSVEGAHDNKHIDKYFQDITKAELLREGDVFWADTPKTTLADNEVILSLDGLNSYDMNNGDSYGFLDRIMAEADKTYDDYYNMDAETAKLVIKQLDAFKLHLHIWNYSSYDGTEENDGEETLKIVGLFDPAKSGYSSAIAISSSLFEKYAFGTEGDYENVIGAMPESASDIRKTVEYCYRDGVKDPEYRYEINSATTSELSTIDRILKELAKVFFWVGVGFAVFAALLMANFITTSIHYKRQEIGILRAIGSRSADVFRIFFSESFVIAMINFVLSCGCCIAAVMLINYVIRKTGILVTILHFGVRQVLLLVAVSVCVAAIASFLPVRRIAAKKPIDAIRDK